MAQKIDTLLLGGTVITMDKEYTVYLEGAVAVHEDTIVAVGAAGNLTDAYDAADRVDCSGQVVKQVEGPLPRASFRCPQHSSTGFNSGA